MTFREFFQAVWDRNPFPWQERLAALAMAGEWPGSIGLPTAAGKTALIDVAVYALAMGAPKAARRIFFVVDRRIIVDEAAIRAGKLAKRLCEADPASPLGKIADSLRRIGDGAESEPLVSAILRGGVPRDESWTKSPRQPLVICSTVDQVGSSLLFRAYGTGPYGWPVRAALAAYDALIIVDEAHTSQPFVQTLARIRRYRDRAEQRLVAPFTVIEMSATPRGAEVFRENEDDRDNSTLKDRWEAAKRARLVVEEMKSEDETGDDFTPLAGGLVREARDMRDRQGARVVGVIANRVRTARTVFAELSRDESSQTILMTGRARAWDRDRIWEEWCRYIKLDREDAFGKPIFVVATQCIEVGANIDFDALVTEVASIDALEQRFGRLNRGGRTVVSAAAIVAQKIQTASRYDDKVYGKALYSSWVWLKGHLTKMERTIELPAEGKKKPKTKKIREEFVEMGVVALREALQGTADRDLLVSPRRNAPVLMPAHVDLLCQTAPEPAYSPEPAIFLHGPRTEPADVQVIWRQDINPEFKSKWIDTVAICPPSAAEAVSLPVWAVRQWLREKDAPGLSDLEGVAEEEIRERGEGREGLCWEGPDDSRRLTPDEVGPGMTLVVPAIYGGCDHWGWNPESKSEVADIGDAVKLKMGRPMLRLDKKLADEWNYADLATALGGADTVPDARALLRNWDGGNADAWVKEAAQSLGKSGTKLVDNPDADNEMWGAFSGRAFEPESVWSADSKEPSLDAHLTGCAEWAARFSDGLPERLKSTVVRAAELHDIGKADPRFQAWLRGGNPVRPHELIAKSKKSGRNRAAIERARELAGYPKGTRHELLSVTLVAKGQLDDAGKLDGELLLHLIGSHHGRCRPFAPAPMTDDPTPARVSYGGWSASSDHGLESVGSGVSERFWVLIHRYGWYGLAWLEMLVRLADHRQSAEEQKNGGEMKGAAHA